MEAGGHGAHSAGMARAMDCLCLRRGLVHQIAITDHRGMMQPEIRQSPARQRLRLLLDTNVFIAVEPYAGTMEDGIAPAARLIQLASKLGHTLLVHPAIRDDLLEGKESSRKAQRLAELDKYPMLEETPVSQSLIKHAGASDPGTNDHRDLRLLAALHGRAANYLISEDVRLRRRAKRAGVGDAVLTVNEAVSLLQSFLPATPLPPPRVENVAAYALDIEQEIFTSLREDYSSFNEWLDKVRNDSDNRTCLVVKDEDVYAALAILKDERSGEYGLSQPVFKICTFKVASGYGGSKYGELLLKAVFSTATARRMATIYVEVLPKHEFLIEFLNGFGFTESTHRTERGELVLVKNLVPPADATDIDDLSFHALFGPPALKMTGRAFLVPIMPRWHRQLFPDFRDEEARGSQLILPGMPIVQEVHPWGNALRKAYLCNSNTNALQAGDTLFFYRSHDMKAVTTVGVVEKAIRSQDPDEVITFVGRRTVYTPDEIASMCRSVRGVLAILFRQDRFVEPPWQLAELEAHGVVRAWPQTIVQVSERGCQWLREQLGA